ncbi:hypothetical protein G7K_5075-t2 [Saitoella complicata NRRL Y-17804]|uniref:Uncharacterized protein n=2 Tax=Saitoella complicata (strain BCRC 22490 / CBS 7301 / JCM 7358 / NBRC 10748 / NRRL Y-17804) TaxID=698492 RepID=A0A0E9NM55_SAICN|nr:hypothetical protein G7K_5075-t2 [Saitoella complicata NRRL Y-17804]
MRAPLQCTPALLRSPRLELQVQDAPLSKPFTTQSHFHGPSYSLSYSLSYRLSFIMLFSTLAPLALSFVAFYGVVVSGAPPPTTVVAMGSAGVTQVMPTETPTSAQGSNKNFGSFIEGVVNGVVSLAEGKAVAGSTIAASAIPVVTERKDLCSTCHSLNRPNRVATGHVSTVEAASPTA